MLELLKMDHRIDQMEGRIEEEIYDYCRPRNQVRSLLLISCDQLAINVLKAEVVSQLQVRDMYVKWPKTVMDLVQVTLIEIWKMFF